MKKQLLIFALAGLVFTACKKDKDDAPKPQLLKKITHIENGDTTKTNISYDNSNRVILVKSDDGEETKLSYTGTNLSSVENKIDAVNKTKLAITYDGAKPKSAVYTVYENDVQKEKFNYTYTVNASNQVSEILVKDEANAVVVAKHVITYTSNNINKIQSYAGTTLASTQEYTYGSKKSAFFSARALYVVDVFMAELYAANEVTKHKVTIGTVASETTNTYTYDTKGFPVSADVSEKTLPNGTPETSKLKFEY